jgi:hypothetical protein
MLPIVLLLHDMLPAFFCFIVCIATVRLSTVQYHNHRYYGPVPFPLHPMYGQVASVRPHDGRDGPNYR